MATNVQNTVNGVNVEQMLQTIDAIKANPGLARFQFRATSQWVSGGHSRTTIKGFYGAGQEDTTRTKPFIIDGDEPAVLLGDDTGPNAVESILQALASCLTVGFSYNAAARGINVRSLELKLEGNIDLHGFLALSDKVRPGYNDIRLVYHVDCDASPEQVAELWSHVKKTSPVLDIIRNPVKVDIVSSK